jgi:hypothetical protein
MYIESSADSRPSFHYTPGISFRLKEEKTRIRIHDEKKVKERQRAPWVHLPDRPVHGQRPYYSW